jgi:hypothetical protein
MTLGMAGGMDAAFTRLVGATTPDGARASSTCSVVSRDVGATDAPSAAGGREIEDSQRRVLAGPLAWGDGRQRWPHDQRTVQIVQLE